MSDTHSQPSPAANAGKAHYVRIALAVIGVLVVLYGAHDVFIRFGVSSLDNMAIAQLPDMAEPTFRVSAPPVTPVQLIVPAIGVAATVEPVGKNEQGAMATPKSFTNVGWYTLGAKPGEAGNAVFAGHVNNALTKAGVFEHLSDIKKGDTVAVVDAAGSALVFAVTSIEDYADDAPLSTIFSTDGPAGLVLITCAGDWDPRAHSYNKRLVVYARLLVN